jgi:tetratricopeptide (TPR) repeat protein
MWSFFPYAYWKNCCFFLLAVLFFPTAHSYAQDGKIDSLKSILLLKNDTAKIDCLNSLSNLFILHVQKDSAVLYAERALSEANAINYIHGTATALSKLGQIAKHFDDDFVRSEALCRDALRWYKKTANKNGIEDVYYYLAYSLIAQSRFNEVIYWAKKLHSRAIQTNNQSLEFEALAWLFEVYRQSGDYENGFDYAQKKFELATKAANKTWLSRSYWGFAQLYMLIEDYPKSLSYFRQAFEIEDDEIRKFRVRTDNDIWFKTEFTEVFSHLRQFDSAWHHYELFKPKDKPIYLRVYWVSTGECYLREGNYLEALQNFELSLAENVKRNDRNEVMRCLLDIGKAQLGLNNHIKALQYGTDGLAIALRAKSKQFIRDGYYILSAAYEGLGQKDSANFYFRQYITWKEEVLSDRVKGQLAAYHYEQKIALINKEKEIQQTKLAKEVLFKKALIAGTFLLMLIAFLLVRNFSHKRKHEKDLLEQQIALQKAESKRTRAEMQRQAKDLEMQALRAQMNPHFIFNSLNSINHFILQNNKAQASEYLTKFSRLVRMILQNSQAPLIPLESELEALQLYLDLESLRFEQHFCYKVTVKNDLEIFALKVPPLIIQPYVENAIWHGLMHKEDKGRLDIEIEQEDSHLYVKISDDGVGRQKAAELAVKSTTRQKSMGLKLTADRIAIFQNSIGNESPVIINDLTYPDGSAAGTEVILKVPARYD